MLNLNVSVHADDLPKVLEQTIYDAKAYTLSVIRKDFAKFQAAGLFPKDKDEYTLLVKSYGRSEQRRQLETIRPQFFKVGTKRSPTTFTFIAGTGNSEDVIQASLVAFHMAYKRAPVDNGNYKRSLTVRIKNIYDLGATAWKEINFRQIPDVKFDKDTILQIVPETVRVSGWYPQGYPYGLAIEEGYFAGYYKKTLKDGILFYVAKKLQARFKGKVAIRFRYINYGGHGTFPGIEIAHYGTFVSRNKRPGAKRRKAARKAKALARK